MSIIKKTREQLGYTQIELSKKTSLSLRTIQRLEASNKEPKGYSLITLSDVFNIEPSVFQEKFHSVQHNRDSDILSIKTINLSVLSFFIIPFGNIIFPVIIWRRKRQSKLVNEIGRKIINFQIIWSIVLYFLLCVSPFVNIMFFSYIPLIFVILFAALAINIAIVGYTSILLQRNKIDFLNLPIKFL